MRPTCSRKSALRLLAALLALATGTAPAPVRAQADTPQQSIGDGQPAVAAPPLGVADTVPAAAAREAPRTEDTTRQDSEPELASPSSPTQSGSTPAATAKDAASSPSASAAEATSGPASDAQATPAAGAAAPSPTPIADMPSRAPPGPAAVPLATPASPAAGKKTLPHDLSPSGMFQAADIVVKVVMVGLALASFTTWTVWIAKGVELFSVKRRMRRAIALINAADSLHDAAQELASASGSAGALVRAASEELVKSAPLLDRISGEGILARVTSRLTRVEAAAARRITTGTGVLATIGATAPFVGLFGTVWGIMNAFIGISETQTTNLAVVAPGIAEALMATALGLVAAIPAVVIYNAFSRSTASYRQLLADAAAGVERLVSRDLDFRHVSAAHAPAMFMRAAE